MFEAAYGEGDGERRLGRASMVVMGISGIGEGDLDRIEPLLNSDLEILDLDSR